MTFTFNLKMFDQIPTEIIMKILQELENDALLNISLVNRKLFGLSTDPSLWQEFNILYGSGDDLIKSLKIKRFKKIRNIKISNDYLEKEFTEKELNTVFKLLSKMNIENITFSNINMQTLNTKLLIKTLKKTKWISIEEEAHFHNSQILKILQNIPKSSISTFQAKFVDFTHINATDLSKIVNKLSKFSTHNCEFSGEQVKMIFQQMSKETKLDYCGMNFPNYKKLLENVPASTFSSAVNNVHTFFVQNGGISNYQIMTLFEKMAFKSNLQNLYITFSDNIPIQIPVITGSILSKAINRLQLLEAPNISFTNSQLKAILERASDKNSKIRYLNVGYITFPLLELRCSKILLSKLEKNDFRHQIETKMLEVELKMKQTMKRKLEQNEALESFVTPKNKRPRL